MRGFFIYANNEESIVLARIFDECRDNLGNSQSVFPIVVKFGVIGYNFVLRTYQFMNEINKTEWNKMEESKDE